MTWWLLVVLTIGATARLCRLVTADYITRHPREWVTRRFGKDSSAAYFVTCDFCVSMYIAPAVAVAAVLWGDNRVVQIGLIALTASIVTGLLTQLESA